MRSFGRVAPVAESLLAGASPEAVQRCTAGANDTGPTCRSRQYRANGPFATFMPRSVAESYSAQLRPAALALRSNIDRQEREEVHVRAGAAAVADSRLAFAALIGVDDVHDSDRIVRRHEAVAIHVEISERAAHSGGTTVVGKLLSERGHLAIEEAAE